MARLHPFVSCLITGFMPMSFNSTFPHFHRFCRAIIHDMRHAPAF